MGARNTIHKHIALPTYVKNKNSLWKRVERSADHTALYNQQAASVAYAGIVRKRRPDCDWPFRTQKSKIVKIWYARPPVLLERFERGSKACSFSLRIFSWIDDKLGDFIRQSFEIALKHFFVGVRAQTRRTHRAMRDAAGG